MANVTATPMTMTQKIIAIAVTIIIISTVALPVIQDMEDGQSVTELNTTEQYKASYNSTGTVVMAIDGSGNLVVNGDIIADKPSWSVLAASSKAIISIGASNSAFFVIRTASTYDAADIMTWSNGTITFSYQGGTEKTIDEAGDLYYISKTGNYGLFYGETFDFHIDNGSTAMVALQHSWSSTIPAFYGTFTVTDNVFTPSEELPLVMNSTSSSGSDYAEPTSYTLSLTTVADGDNPNKIVTGYDLSLTNSDSTYDLTEGLYIFTKLGYTVIQPNEYVNLFSVICILLILVPVMMAVRMIALKRN